MQSLAIYARCFILKVELEIIKPPLLKGEKHLALRLK